MTILILLIFNVGIVATLLLSLIKMRVFEWYETHKPIKFWNVCYFCLGFWISFPVALSLHLFIFTDVAREIALLVPFVSASFIRFLIAQQW
jgi:hypothetical protein